MLLVSGTTSIVVHATMHPDNAVEQTRETMINIKAVLAEANSRDQLLEIEATAAYPVIPVSGQWS